MSTYHLDYETRSRADLKKVGAARYASDPSTRILMFAIAQDEEEPLLWLNPVFGVPCPTNDRAMALLTAALNDPLSLIYAHNAPFEIAVSQYRMLLDLKLTPPDLAKWRCTAALARKAGIRASLANAGDDLNLPQLKFGYGFQLIKRFSIPQKDGQFIEPKDDAPAFLEFGRYCVQDVRSERELHRALKPFELKGATLESFLFDLRMNQRGFPVNVPALRHAQTIIEEMQGRVSAEFTKLTGLEPTQRAKIKKLLEVKYGIKLPNMQGETLDKHISYHEDAEEADELADSIEELLGSQADLNAEGKRVMELYRMTSFTAVSKVKTMLDCACDDWRVRGMFAWYGAGTGRWSAQKVQPHNFKKPTLKDADGVYQMIVNGCSADEIEMVYGNPLEAVANCIRNFIHDVDPNDYALGPIDDIGEPIFDVDYSAIEARIVAWLANEEWRLKVFRTHGKIYEASASEMFRIPMQQVTKAIRQKGKVAELALGYQGAVNAMKKMGALKMGLKEEELPDLVKLWRKASPNIVAAWYELESCAINAVQSPGSKFSACDGKISFRCGKLAGIPYLLMQLPSGRVIAYPHPRITDEDGFTYYGQIPGTAKWGRVNLYGGKILENATQGIAADIMGGGSVNAEKAGFEIFMLVHDQALAHAQPGRLQEFIAALTKLPDWATGLPLTADGEEAPYYRKDP